MVHHDTQINFSSSSKILTSHTIVDFPSCKTVSISVTIPSFTSDTQKRQNRPLVHMEWTNGAVYFGNELVLE